MTETSASQVCSHFGHQPLVEIGDADRGVRAGHFAAQRAGHGEAGRQVVAGRDSQPFYAVFQLVELAVEADFAVAQDGDALGDPLQVARDVRAEQDRLLLVLAAAPAAFAETAGGPTDRGWPPARRAPSSSGWWPSASTMPTVCSWPVESAPTRSSSGTCQRSQSLSTKAGSSCG